MQQGLSDVTFFMVKPDGAKHMTMIMTTLSQMGLKPMRCAILSNAPPKKVKQHYAEHKGKPFYDALVDFICSGVITIYELKVVEKRMDAVFVGRRACDYIRQQYANPDVKRENVVHASDSVHAAQRELKIWFDE